ncbi:btb poz domain protein [Diplodia corticola]|uniref:Btb poz domain protein n=1 Tax=Diplodia corticola TaxID=236234 RepID=A0A1J9QTM9_9PEZI|nr:btb poz domain protein [Diplodia corticola]OJD32334.1 btb poz domain protein [Diplodia corticola]
METSDDENFPTLREGLRKCLASGEGSDMTIKCGDTVHNVHRMIVCVQSSFFANAMKKEHNFEEAQTNVVDLSDDDPAVVQAAIRFMYTGHYSVTELVGQDEKIDMHLSVYFFADRCGIGGLREYCTKEIKKLLETDFFRPELFLRIVSAAYNNIPENDSVLHYYLGMTASKNFPALLRQKNFWDIANAAGRFSTSTLRALAGQGIIPGTYNGVGNFICRNCDRNVILRLSRDTRVEIRGCEHWIAKEPTFCPSCGADELTEVWLY